MSGGGNAVDDGKSKTRVRRWFARWRRGRFVPLPVSRPEWFIMRLLFAAVVFHSFLDWKPFTYDSQPRPTGIAKLLPLTFLNHEAAFAISKTIAGVFLAIYLTGFRTALLVSLPVLTLGSTLVRSFANSQGFTHHGYQIVTLTLLAQTAVVWYVSIWEWRRGERWRFAPGVTLSSYLAYYSQGVILATYVIAALTKIIKSKGLWVANARYICIELVKSNRTMYYKSLDPELAGTPAVAVWLLKHPLLATVFFGAGFLLELCALAGLRDRGWAFLTGVALIVMHRVIMLTMGLTFHYNEALLAIFLLNVPFWLIWLGTRGRRPHQPL